MRKKLTISFLLIITLISFAFSVKTFNISQEKLDKFTQKYGEKAKIRVLVWDEMVENAKSKDILHKLKDVNDFFNKIKYQTDQSHWGKKDYWAAPFEFMGTGAGDCEDYAIAKYFTLRKLGVP
ncbi:MAG: transglutaminase-like cysteine peptidase, partial [Arcobacter sp.]